MRGGSEGRRVGDEEGSEGVGGEEGRRGGGKRGVITHPQH